MNYNSPNQPFTLPSWWPRYPFEERKGNLEDFGGVYKLLEEKLEQKEIELVMETLYRQGYETAEQAILISLLREGIIKTHENHPDRTRP
jgi:hypothetical protein